MVTHKKHAPEKTAKTAARHRRIQDKQAAKDAGEHKKPARSTTVGKSGKKASASAQTGQRRYPEPPIPGRTLRKPGNESELAPRPRFMAPDYRGSGKLEDKCALITGGDSGIGRAVAVLFAREGADVAIVYLSEEADALETCRHVEAEGRRCVAIAGDVKDPAFCGKAVEETVRQLGKLDILVNNAAFQEHADALSDLSDERFDETMKVNVYGYFYMARAALPYLREGAAIINTGSVTGLKGSATLLDYSTTKGGIHAFTMALAANLAKKGIRVNAVAPGPVWTPLNPADKSADAIRAFGAETALGRPAQPEEISPAYVFLASALCSSYITGTVLPITGSPGQG